MKYDIRNPVATRPLEDAVWGDLLAVRHTDNYGRAQPALLHYVERVTKTLVVTTTGTRFRKSDGKEINGHGTAFIVSPEYAEAVRKWEQEYQEEIDLRFWLSSLRNRNLSLDVIKAMKKVYDENCG